MIAWLLAQSSDGGGTPLLLLIGPAGAFAVYFGLYRYYRNTDKSHSFETSTRVVAQPITGSDQKIDQVTGTSRSNISGENHTEHRQRVQRMP